MSQPPHGCGTRLSNSAAPTHATASTHSAAQPRVLLYFELNQKHLRDLVSAATQHLRQSGAQIHWTEQLSEARRLLPQCDAALGWNLAPVLADRSDTPHWPVVVQLQPAAYAPGPRSGVVLPAYGEIAALAAEHLLGHGHRRFAFVGYANHAASQELYAAYAHAVGNRPLDRLELPLPEANDSSTRESLVSSLGARSRPLAVFAADDLLGARVLEACRSIDVQVPGEVAVMGVSDDESRCVLASHALSSIDINAARLGREIASLALRLLAGEAAPAEPVRVAPIGPITRQSTQSLPVADSLVAQAVEMIRLDPLKLRRVDHVAERLLVCRRTLERAFKAELGWSPAEEIRRAWRDRARHLVGRTDQPLKVVARACGHRHFNKFAIAFKRATGQRPSEFRAKLSGGRATGAAPIRRLQRHHI